VRTLLISVIMVITLTWVLLPALTRVFGPWLAQRTARSMSA